jgi:predicted DNA-binding transcriptional regulator AlpA
MADGKRYHLDKRAPAIIATFGADDKLLTTPELADLLGCSVAWLTIGRGKGWGPPFIKLAPRRVRYRQSAVIAWLDSRTYERTADDPELRTGGVSPGRPRKDAA